MLQSAGYYERNMGQSAQPRSQLELIESNDYVPSISQFRRQSVLAQTTV